MNDEPQQLLLQLPTGHKRSALYGTYREWPPTNANTRATATWGPPWYWYLCAVYGHNVQHWPLYMYKKLTNNKYQKCTTRLLAATVHSEGWCPATLWPRTARKNNKHLHNQCAWVRVPEFRIGY